MRRKGIILAVTLLATMFSIGGSVVADEGHAVQITATAETSDQCGSDTWCWTVEKSGSLDPGANVEVTVEVPDEDGQSAHSLYVADSGYDEGGNTDPSTAIAGTENAIGPGESTTFSFTVPDDAGSLYFWCEEGAHEQLGMYWTESLGQDGGGTDGGGDEEPQSSPGLGLIAGLSGLALAAFALSRRR